MESAESYLAPSGCEEGNGREVQINEIRINTCNHEVGPTGGQDAMGRTICWIRAESTTITFDDGSELTVPRKSNELPTKTLHDVAKVLRVDRFNFATQSM